MKLNSLKKNYGLLLILGIIWGSSFILMKKGIIVFSTNEVAMFRLGIAWLTLLPFTWKSIKSIFQKSLETISNSRLVWKWHTCIFIYRSSKRAGQLINWYLKCSCSPIYFYNCHIFFKNKMEDL